MKSVAFLHTADAHISTFDTLFESADPVIVRIHAAHPEWLAEAQESGLSEDLRARHSTVDRPSALLRCGALHLFHHRPHCRSGSGDAQECFSH